MLADLVVQRQVLNLTLSVRDVDHIIRMAKMGRDANAIAASLEANLNRKFAVDDVKRAMRGARAAGMI